MSIDDAVKILENYSLSRRGCDYIEQPSKFELCLAIDTVIDYFKNT